MCVNQQNKTVLQGCLHEMVLRQTVDGQIANHQNVNFQFVTIKMSTSLILNFPDLI
jgi:hypothetical protein